MYIFEWVLFDGRKKVNHNTLTKDTSNQKTNPKTLLPIRVTQRVSSTISDNLSFYSYTPTYIDARTPNDEKRGLITLIPGVGGALPLCMLMSSLYYIGGYYISAFSETDEQLNSLDYAFMWVIPAIPATTLYFYIKHVAPYLRLELFTARRLIVRFNRITRKVYLLRPKHLGGIVALDWDAAEVCIDPNMSELEGTGGFVMLGWDKETRSVRDADGNLKDDFEVTLVGRPTRNASELLAFWEYIRRYMDEGPEAAPKPTKLIGKFPWPWRSFMAVWRLDSRLIKTPALWVFVLVYSLLLPLIVIHAFGHWVSLLLCYEPKFPKSIEKAGIE
ncbi:hypothetical protein HFV04_022930 [Pseudomonas sp. BIGb0427]|uniref:DUF6708 domain-containing protein n=1 Tax=unclassified Pseudomonas TaxID=196821 RepID=UPI0018A6EB55|nr:MULTISPECIES: DUF6708 domain-containing protein [unclassified Pseudomonas]QPG62352.1 hypothetical protein HFV04_022930 [Pseudomonas sp. BIGb0427]UVM64703.1 hypothetical protein LOY34_15225 [Pseudomonas sp. B21-009]